MRRLGSFNVFVMLMLAGALQAASLAWPWAVPASLQWLGLVRGQALWWMQIAALAVLVRLLLDASSSRQAAWRGWVFAVAWLAVTFAWLYTSMHVYGGLVSPLAAAAVLVLAGGLASYTALACWAFWPLAQINQRFVPLFFGALWLLAEWARGTWLSGFGWGAVGYAHVSGPLSPLIAWVGLYGTSALAGGFAALLALATKAHMFRARATYGMLALGGLALAAVVPAHHGTDQGVLQVTLLQGNIGQEEKFQPSTGVPKALSWYAQQLLAAQGSLVVTPETAVPLLPGQLPEGYFRALRERFFSGQQAALVGIPLGSFSEGYTNSIVGLRPEDESVWRYDKHHLVPFGEFIPPFFRWFTDLMNIPLGDFNRGALPQPTFDWAGQRLAATVCYENLFTEELATQFTDAAKAPTVLVNISNMGWFGEHLAMDQHLQIARMRSLEFDRPFLLATNTGRTAIVDHRGRVTHQVPSHAQAVLQGDVTGRAGITPYAAWVSAHGLLPLWVGALAVVFAGAWVRRRHLERAANPV